MILPSAVIYSRITVLASSFLKIAGELLDNALLQEVTVVQELNAHTWCDVVCRQTMDKRFPAEDLLGQELTLSTVDENGASLDIFSGFILESELEYEIYGSQTARLRAVSQSYLMDVTPRREYYFQKQPQDVAQSLADAAGLSLDGQIAGQKLSYVQMEETDFHFLLRFVDESEQWLRPSKDGIEVRDAFQPGATLSWRGEFGLSHFGVAGKLAARQLTGAHYDYRKMQSEVLSGVQDEPALFGSSSRMSGAVKAQAAKLGEGFVTARDRLLGVDDLSPRLKKEARRSTGKMVLCRGVSREQRLRAGDQVSVDGELDTNGTYGLIRVQHKWTVNGYENEFVCTPWQRYTSPEAAPAPRFDGVVSARVADNNDPEGLGRIQIQYYWQEDSFSCWTRAMTPHAGADRGVFCLPEIGDEVWVMFEEGDPERGRVLGSAWNGKMTPPRQELWGGDAGPNEVKRMVTKSGHRISLDDKPGKNAIVVATPEHVKLSMMESSNETGEAMLALHSDGDVLLSAPAGRIHFHSKFWSREEGGADLKPSLPPSRHSPAPASKSGTSTPHAASPLPVGISKNCKGAPATIAIPKSINADFKKLWGNSFPGKKSQEHGGTLVTDSKGAVTLVNPGLGASGTFSPNRTVAAGQTVIGIFHTHPYDSTEGGYTGVSFSGADIAVAANNREPDYVQSGDTQFMVMPTDETPRTLDYTKLNDSQNKRIADLVSSGKDFAVASRIAAKETAQKNKMAYYEGKHGVLHRVSC